MKNFHIAIIGGGVIGSAIARELSRYELDIILFEKESDVASSTSKANSGVIHSGINSPPKSLKAHFCVEGNKIFQSLAEELSISEEQLQEKISSGQRRFRYRMDWAKSFLKAAKFRGRIIFLKRRLGRFPRKNPQLHQVLSSRR